MNQLFIVIGMFIGQSLSFPFAEYSKWRYVFVVSIVMAGLQILASGLIRVPEVHRDVKRRLSEESALLAGESVEPVEEEGILSIKDLFTSKDPIIRKGRESNSRHSECCPNPQSTSSSWCSLPSRFAVSLQASPLSVNPEAPLIPSHVLFNSHPQTCS